MFSNLINSFTGESQHTSKTSHRKSPHRHHKKAPVVKEKVITHDVEEVQPVVDRTVEQTEVQQVIQPVTDHEEKTIHNEAVEMPVETKTSSDIVADEEKQKYNDQLAEVKPEHTTEKDAHKETVVQEPIVHETVQKKQITEVQPVIERVVDETHVQHVRQPIQEHHVASPTVADVVTNPPISAEEFQNGGQV